MLRPDDEPVPPIQNAADEDRWDVQTTDGVEFRRVPLEVVVRGLQEGWLRLEDSVRSNRVVTEGTTGFITLTGPAVESPWQRADAALRRVFEVEVLINPGRAFSRVWGKIGAIAAPGLALGIWWVFLGLRSLNLEWGHAVIFSACMLVLHGALVVTFTVVHRAGGWSALAMSLAFVPVGIVLLPIVTPRIPNPSDNLIFSFGPPLLVLMLMLGKLGKGVGVALLVIFILGSIVLDRSGARSLVLSATYPLQEAGVLVAGAAFGFVIGSLAGWQYSIRHAPRRGVPSQRQPINESGRQFLVGEQLNT